MTMVTRLILALLLMVGAMPALAMPADCHDGMAAATMAMPANHAGRGEHAPVAVEHGCIGCAALPDWLAERITARTAVVAISPLPVHEPFVLRAAGPPPLRPPRIG